MDVYVEQSISFFDSPVLRGQRGMTAAQIIVGSNIPVLAEGGRSTVAKLSNELSKMVFVQ